MMVNFRGADESTTFVDEKGHTVTSYGSPVISTAVHPEGALLLDGVSYVYVSGLTPFGTGDFCIEVVLEQLGASGSDPGNFQHSAVAGGLSPSYDDAITSYAGLTFWGAFVDGAYIGGGDYSTDATHLCVRRTDGVTYHHVDGIVVGQIEDTHDYTGSEFAIGGYYSTGFLGTGRVLASRITVGDSRYTGNFTPPPLPFPNTGA